MKKSLLLIAAMAAASNNIFGGAGAVSRDRLRESYSPGPRKYSPRKTNKGQAGDKLARKAAEGKIGIRS